MIEVIIAISAITVVVGFSIVTRWFLRKQAELLTMYERVGVTPENPVLPEAHILRFKPVPITIKGKTLILDALSLEGHKVYTKKMMMFLARFQQQMGGLRLLLLSDLMSPENLEMARKEWLTLQYNAEMFKAMIEVFESTFLKSKSVNPGRITRRYILENWSWVELVQVFQMMYAVQVQACEDFIRYLLEGQRAGAGKQNAGSPLSRPLVTASAKSQAGPLMPRYSRSNGQAKRTSA